MAQCVLSIGMVAKPSIAPANSIPIVTFRAHFQNIQRPHHVDQCAIVVVAFAVNTNHNSTTTLELIN